jgi:hypothetical protein
VPGFSRVKDLARTTVTSIGSGMAQPGTKVIVTSALLNGS